MSNENKNISVKIEDGYSSLWRDTHAEKIAAPLFTSILRRDCEGKSMKWSVNSEVAEWITKEYTPKQLARLFKDCMKVGYAVLDGMDELDKEK